jgi:hypothetical protein
MVKENSLSVRKIIKLFNQWTLKKNGSGSKSEYDKENKITFLKTEKEIVGVGFGYSVSEVK